MQRKVGIYSGTFDPVHLGHVAFAREAQRRCQLAEVVFLPEQTPRGKTVVTDLFHRIALLERALTDEPGMRVATLTSPQFTVAQTLPEIRALLPNTQLVLLMGSDVVKTFTHRWEGLEALLREVELAIGLRAHDIRKDLAGILTHIEKTYHMPVRHTFITTDNADIASSHIRKGGRRTEWLHPDLLRYIQEHQLYLEQ